MSSAPGLPISVLLARASKEGAGGAAMGGEPQKKTREDWRKAKQLEEDRKAGTAPAAVDEEGRDINPHIPQYISSAPWYYNTEGPTLKHQRPQTEEVQSKFARVGDWYQRGVNLDSLTTKYRKGACENCGALTHKRKDCMERLRKVGARFSGSEIAPDEFVQPKLSLDFDAKRDRWNGYDPAEHAATVEEFARVEEAKRQLKAARLETGDEDEVDEDEVDEDEDKYVDEIDMPGTKVDSKQRITVRNLRIREDTAKYLRNLDPNSAYYDPKTRSMRDNPYRNTGKEAEEVDYAGENFLRYTGDTSKHGEAQLFAWEAGKAGVDVHLLAEPTKAEKLKTEYIRRKEEVRSTVQQSILERYGGAEHLQAPPKALLLAQTEHYVEYSRTGKIIKGAEKPVVRSKFEEDVYPSNHHSVWGSYWKDGVWGYQCCHSTIKNSYCTGDRGKDVRVPATAALMPPPAVPSSSSSSVVASGSGLKQQQQVAKFTLHDDGDDDDDYEDDDRRKKQKEKSKKRKKKDKKRRRRDSSSSSSSDDDSSSASDSEDESRRKKKKLAKALVKESGRLRKADRLMDDRKRPFNSMQEEVAPTEEEIEAYYMKRKRDEDPMAAFM